MTSFKFPSAPAWLLAFASAPWLLSSACSDDDADPNVSSAGGSSGSGGTTAAGGGGGNVGVSGSGGTGGSSGTAGSAGANNPAGSGGGMNGADAGPSADAGGPDASAQALTLRSPAFDDNAACDPDDRAACDLFPDDNIGLGQARNVSPEINWTAGPTGTQSYAIALHDLTYFDVGQDPYTHWVMWNIPGSATGLPAELPSGANPPPPAPVGSQQVSFANNLGYTGSGACGNVYEFVLYALDTATFEPSDDSDADAVEAELEASATVLDTATMRARSDPNGPTCN